MTVAEFAAVMGLKVDEASWKRGDAVLQSLAAKLGAVGVRFDASAAGFRGAGEDAAAAFAGAGDSASVAGGEFVAAADGMKSSASEVLKGVAVVAAGAWLLHKAVTLATKAIMSAVGALKSFVVESVESSMELERMSAALGVSTDELQRLGYVASHAGVDTGALAGALASLSSKSLETSKGNEQLIYTLSRVGVSLYDGSGRIKASTVLLGDIADGLNRVRNPMLKATLAQELLNNSAANLAPLIARGSAGVAELVSDFDALGAAASEADIAAGVKLGASLTRLRTIAGALRAAIAGPLLEPLTQLADAFTELGKSVKPFVASGIERAVGALALVVTHLGSGVAWVADKWKLLASIAGGALLVALGANNAALATQLGLWLSLQAAAIRTAATRIASDAWVVASVVAATAVILAEWTFAAVKSTAIWISGNMKKLASTLLLKSVSLGAASATMFGWIRSAAVSTAAWIASSAASIPALLATGAAGVAAGAMAAGAAISAAVSFTAAWIAATWPVLLLIGIIAILADEIYGFATGAESIIGDFVYLVVELWHLLRDAGIAAWSALSEWLDGFITRASDAFVRLKDKVVEVFKGIVDAVLAPFRAVLDAIEKVKSGGVLAAAKDFAASGANALFGTGASGPGGSTSSNTSNRSTVIGAPRIEVTVTGAPGQSAEELGGEVASSMGSELSRVLADAAAAGGY